MPYPIARVAILAVALLTTPAQAAERGCAYDAPPAGLAPDDAARFSELVESRAAALAEALRGEDEGERAVVADLLAAERQARPSDDAVLGNWRCRVAKVGGLLPIVVYDFFDCRISREGDGLRIAKLTGSQLFSGALTPSGQGWAYVGAGYVQGESPRAYGTSAEEDEVGCLAALSPDRLLLELPRPRLESNHNLLELVRRR